MDFRQTPQPTARPAAMASPDSSVEAPRNNGKAHKNGGNNDKWARISSGIVLIGAAILILLAVVAVVFMSNGGDNEHKLVNKDKYQAVFLNNGQVYFGHVNTLNNKYVELTDIYYLTQNSTSGGANATTDGNYTLVKLGCQQIHDPYDQMVINRDQVSFWENIQSNGKVTKSIADFKKQNPNGPDCSQVSNQTQASDSAKAQNAAGTNGQPAATPVAPTAPTQNEKK
ncbi:MAG: hypothetical protein ABI220_00050 [Candidatus Saccharimonadales bacterium]